MARLIIENVTMEQAKLFASWYEGQGEQDCYEWFSMRDVKAPLVDVNKKWLNVDAESETVTLLCKEM